MIPCFLLNVDPQSLVDDLEGDTHGHFEDILVALVTPPAQFDMQEIKKAMKVRALHVYLLCDVLSSVIIEIGFIFFPCINNRHQVSVIVSATASG